MTPAPPESAWTFPSIGTLRTPFERHEGTPIQPRYAADTLGHVDLFAPYVDGLKDLAGFERVWLLFVLDRAKAWQPLATPYLDTVPRGVFATRAPARPSPIGLSVVELLAVEGARLRVRGVDMLDQSPLIDIKPYVPRFDAYPESAAGWLDARSQARGVADGRFSRDG